MKLVRTLLGLIGSVLGASFRVAEIVAGIVIIAESVPAINSGAGSAHYLGTISSAPVVGASSIATGV